MGETKVFLPVNYGRRDGRLVPIETTYPQQGTIMCDGALVPAVRYEDGRIEERGQPSDEPAPDSSAQTPALLEALKAYDEERASR